MNTCMSFSDDYEKLQLLCFYLFCWLSCFLLFLLTSTEEINSADPNLKT